MNPGHFMDINHHSHLFVLQGKLGGKEGTLQLSKHSDLLGKKPARNI